jgi:hypothetical protein
MSISFCAQFDGLCFYQLDTHIFSTCRKNQIKLFLLSMATLAALLPIVVILKLADAEGRRLKLVLIGRDGGAEIVRYRLRYYFGV